MERIDDLNFEGLKIIQDTEGFCFGIDSVLLTDFARDIKKNSKIMDLGTGTGILSILLSKKVNPKKIYGIEIQKEVAEMARRSVELNSLEEIIEIINTDIKDLNKLKKENKDLENNTFDAIVTNPPYKKLGTGIKNKNKKQIISRYETSTTLDDWLNISSKLLKNNGQFYIVFRTDRLTELITNMKKYNLEIKNIRFVYSNINEQSILVLIKAVKGAGTFLKVEKPLIIYDENNNYTDEILKIYNIK